MLRTPAKSQTDKVIKYIRYADDFLIGVNGNREECQVIRQPIREKIEAFMFQKKELDTTNPIGDNPDVQLLLSCK